VEPVMDNILTEYVNHLYITTAHKEDYINPAANGMLSWSIISSYASDSDMGVKTGNIDNMNYLPRDVPE
jgi:hypothetical protein